MEKYRVIKKLGEGAFGAVVKCVNTKTNQLVAIKKMKGQYANWQQAVKMPEVVALQKLNNSPFLIKIVEMVHNKKENEVNIVFEYCEKNLYQDLQVKASLNKLYDKNEIRNLMYQAIAAVAYMHQNGYMHRDLKPENFLINPENMQLKLADFGLAKEIKKNQGNHTEYVSTRWYRAPELVMRSQNYNQSVDIFALGCIMAEMYVNRPLYPGTSEQDQLTRILTVLGTPSKQEWPEGHRLSMKKNVSFPNIEKMPLREHLTSRNRHDLTEEAIDLLSKMFKYDHDKRISAKECLNHPYFQDVPQNLKSLSSSIGGSRGVGIAGGRGNMQRKQVGIGGMSESQSESQFANSPNKQKESGVGSIATPGFENIQEASQNSQNVPQSRQSKQNDKKKDNYDDEFDFFIDKKGMVPPPAAQYNNQFTLNSGNSNFNTGNQKSNYTNNIYNTGNSPNIKGASYKASNLAQNAQTNIFGQSNNIAEFNKSRSGFGNNAINKERNKQNQRSGMTYGENSESSYPISPKKIKEDKTAPKPTRLGSFGKYGVDFMSQNSGIGGSGISGRVPGASNPDTKQTLNHQGATSSFAPRMSKYGGGNFMSNASKPPIQQTVAPPSKLGYSPLNLYDQPQQTGLSQPRNVRQHVTEPNTTATAQMNQNPYQNRNGKPENLFNHNSYVPPGHKQSNHQSMDMNFRGGQDDFLGKMMTGGTKTSETPNNMMSGSNSSSAFTKPKMMMMSKHKIVSTGATSNIMGTGSHSQSLDMLANKNPYEAPSSSHYQPSFSKPSQKRSGLGGIGSSILSPPTNAIPIIKPSNITLANNVNLGPRKDQTSFGNVGASMFK